MKTLHLIILLGAAGLFVSCGMHSTLPPTVTNPQVIETFNKAKQGDGESLYRIALMYKHGTNGFPESSFRASTCMRQAADAPRPSAAACYEEYLFWKRDLNHSYSVTSERYMNDYLRKAARYGDSRAIAILDAPAAEMRAQEEERRRFLATHTKCTYCDGKGLLLTGEKNPIYKEYKVYNNERQFLHSDKRVSGWYDATEDCPHCVGGYVDRY